MLRYPCLVLDHDDTVVQTLKTLSYPFFCYILNELRPGEKIPLNDYVIHCHNLSFVGMCREIFRFTDEELAHEHDAWTQYIQTHIPDAYPGISQLVRRQKEAGGRIFVVSHSASDTISRDYDHHFGLQPDAIYGWDHPSRLRKPDPFPLKDIMENYGYTPEQILVVDDMKMACQMAQPFGVDVGFANWGEMGVEALSREMKELCRWSFESPDELYRLLFEEESYGA